MISGKKFEGIVPTTLMDLQKNHYARELLIGSDPLSFKRCEH